MQELVRVPLEAQAHLGTGAAGPLAAMEMCFLGTPKSVVSKPALVGELG